MSSRRAATGRPCPFNDRVQRWGGKLFGAMLMLSLADSKPEVQGVWEGWPSNPVESGCLSKQARGDEGDNT